MWSECSWPFILIVKDFTENGNYRRIYSMGFEWLNWNVPIVPSDVIAYILGHILHEEKSQDFTWSHMMFCGGFSNYWWKDFPFYFFFLQKWKIPRLIHRKTIKMKYWNKLVNLRSAAQGDDHRLRWPRPAVVHRGPVDGPDGKTVDGATAFELGSGFFELHPQGGPGSRERDPGQFGIGLCGALRGQFPGSPVRGAAGGLRHGYVREARFHWPLDPQVEAPPRPCRGGVDNGAHYILKEGAPT